MKAYVGITDFDWYTQLASNSYDEVNFWRPGGGSSFKALEPGDLFLFKLHSPLNYIVGGGFFVSFSILPTFLAWEAFGEKNGTKTLEELERRIAKYKKGDSSNPNIGCIILSDPFFFPKEEWIPAPIDWHPSIVQGKTYSNDNPVGYHLIESVRERIPYYANGVGESSYGYTEGRYRLGQGGFRILVTDAYNRRCAISGEKTLPVLEAAHIKPYSLEGVHKIDNGILLRKDIHVLLDRGYLTITPTYNIEVSQCLNADYGNGKIYYQYHGLLLSNLPSRENERPSKESLIWHNENIFK